MLSVLVGTTIAPVLLTLSLSVPAIPLLVSLSSASGRVGAILSNVKSTDCNRDNTSPAAFFCRTCRVCAPSLRPSFRGGVYKVVQPSSSRLYSKIPVDTTVKAPVLLTASALYPVRPLVVSSSVKVTVQTGEILKVSVTEAPSLSVAVTFTTALLTLDVAALLKVRVAASKVNQLGRAVPSDWVAV